MTNFGISKRTERVGELIKQELSKLIKEELPEDYGIVCVNDCLVTPDFKEAKIYISCLDKSREKVVLKLLEEKKRDFQRFLGKNLTMKFTPRLEFLLDESQQQVEKVEKILEKIEKKEARGS